MSDGNFIEPIPSSSSQIQKIRQQKAQQAIQIQGIYQTETQELYSELLSEPLQNLVLRNGKSLEERNARKDSSKSTRHSESEPEDNERLIDDISKLAEQFHRNNPELKQRSLLSLTEGALSTEDSAEAIYQKVCLFYPDPYLADEAFSFLQQIHQEYPTWRQNVQIARQWLNDKYNRDIKAGQNIRTETQTFSNKGLGTPTELRHLYRNLTINPTQSSGEIFSDLLERLSSFQNTKKALSFILHAVGSDLKSKGPSIAREELQILLKEIRNAQTFLWMFSFFHHRMPSIQNAFQRAGSLLPIQITFELLGKAFLKLILERYPSLEKVYQIADFLGIDEDVLAQWIIFPYFHTAVSQSPSHLIPSSLQKEELMELFEEIQDELYNLIEEKDEKEEEKKEEDEKEEEEKKDKEL